LRWRSTPASRRRTSRKLLTIVSKMYAEINENEEDEAEIQDEGKKETVGGATEGHDSVVPLDDKEMEVKPSLKSIGVHKRNISTAPKVETKGD